MSGKDRQRLKRKHKRQELRRRQAVSPYRLANRASGEFACYCSQNWRDQGIASILVTKTLSGGGRVLGAFLVDFWCCGLKDAWGRLDVTAEEIEGALDRAEQDGTPMGQVDLDLVRRMVAGGIRFARQNGFRLPHKYERWAALIGVDTRDDGADLSLFGYQKRGKPLCYVGRMSDLRKRLVRSTPEEFLSRPDVDFILGDAGPFGDPDRDADQEDEADSEELGDLDEDEVDEQEIAAELADLQAQMHKQMLEKVRQWCFAIQIAPHPLLPEAIETMLASVMQVHGPADTDPDDPEVVDQAGRLLDNGVQMCEPARQAELCLAMAQLYAWMKTLKSPADLLQITDLPADPETA